MSLKIEGGGSGVHVLDDFGDKLRYEEENVGLTPWYYHFQGNTLNGQWTSLGSINLVPYRKYGVIFYTPQAYITVSLQYQIAYVTATLRDNAAYLCKFTADDKNIANVAILTNQSITMSIEVCLFQINV